MAPRISTALAAFVVIAATPAFAQPQQPPVRRDHLLIATPPQAPAERTALEAAGFRIAPTVNRHDGQGTASATVEFENFFLEFIWPDDSVPVAGEGGARAKQVFTDRMNWRSTGATPFMMALARTPATPAQFPFPTWEVRSEWMEPGTAIVMMTPRGTGALGISMHPRGVDEAANRAAIARGDASAAPFLHPNGARRLTGLRVTVPDDASLPPSADYVRSAGAAEIVIGGEWLAELTLDSHRSAQVRDFRPTLPLVVRW